MRVFELEIIEILAAIVLAIVAIVIDWQLGFGELPVPAILSAAHLLLVTADFDLRTDY